MTHAAEHTIAAPRRKRPALRQRPPSSPRRPACRDARWPEVAATLRALHAARRRSVRIVDADCGSGTLLLCAVRFARAIGFTAIEARGIDAAPALVTRARAAAAALHDPAIGISFERGEPLVALREESAFPADIVLWHGSSDSDDASAARTERAVLSAGRALITDRPVRI